MEILADPITVNCRKVLAGLKMIGADYTLTKIDYFKGEQQSADYLNINPMATIPAMRDGDLLLTESNSVLQYAADKVGNATAYPTDLKPAPILIAGCCGSAVPGFQPVIYIWLRTA